MTVFTRLFQWILSSKNGGANHEIETSDKNAPALIGAYVYCTTKKHGVSKSGVADR
jgi:hypothetical protein